MTHVLRPVVQNATATNSSPVQQPLAAYTGVENSFVSMVNGRVVGSRGAAAMRRRKKMTPKQLAALFSVGLAIGKARRGD